MRESQSPQVKVSFELKAGVCFQLSGFPILLSLLMYASPELLGMAPFTSTVQGSSDSDNIFKGRDLA